MTEPSPAQTRALAIETLAVLDRLLQTVEGGAALDALFDARQVLARFAAQTPPAPTPLAVKLPPTGGVTLVRNGHHFTIPDEDLEAVREAINERKREVRKRQRRLQARTS